MNIYVKSDCEWLYPDEDTLNTPQYNNSTIELNAFLGSAVGVQILLTNVSEALDIYVDSKLHTGEINILREVCVNFNTRDNVGSPTTLCAVPVSPLFAKNSPPDCFFNAQTLASSTLLF